MTPGDPGRVRDVELRIEIEPQGAGAADELLIASGTGNGWILEDVVLKRAWFVGVFPDEPAARQAWRELEGGFASAGIGCLGEPVFRALADVDWRDSYKAHFKAWHFGRLHWVPVWEKDAFQLPKGDAVLWLDPGLAFGTGNHETTRLCVERVVALATELDVARPKTGEAGLDQPALGAPNSGLRVIDAGCGSGILALSAVLMGFPEVIGFDNDPEAIRVSQENAAVNGLAGKVSFFAGDLPSGLDGRQADILLANIQADVLMRFAGELVRAVAPGGALVLGGILAEENAQVRTVFEALAAGWAMNARTMGEWSDLVLVRPRVS
ncbi:MAG: 50S ribosomal protein L11 methyltransferase [Opitutus sp.]